MLWNVRGKIQKSVELERGARARRSLGLSSDGEKKKTSGELVHPELELVNRGVFNQKRLPHSPDSKGIQWEMLKVLEY